MAGKATETVLKLMKDSNYNDKDLYLTAIFQDTIISLIADCEKF